MACVKIGANSVSTVKLGTLSVDYIYIGTTKVYDKDGGWIYPIQDGSTLTIAQVYTITQSGSTLTLE